MATAILAKAAPAPKRNTEALISAWVEEAILEAPPPEKMHFATFLGQRVGILVERLDGPAPI